MLKIEQLSLAFGRDTPVLENVDLELAAGRFMSLIGPSGCGKSTLLRAVTGLQKPSAGRVQLDVKANDIAFLFQDDALLPWRSARDNVALGLRNRGMSRQQARSAADEWLSAVGLDGFGDRWPRQLSGGQRKRVAIAQCLALRPKLLLMDEPFASLDAIVRHYLTSDLLNWVEREQLTVLMVTHDLEEAIALSDEVVLLGNGPRAHIKGKFQVPLERPRNLLEVRADPRFGTLAKELWAALSDEVAPLTSGIGRPALKVVNQ
ncbi:NitT/TauT family transport system ATP-binding protein [Natronocella acetinitrilica]|uniref:NitT/TauT family transport system ATP-binding protein n=1 Tax=Natronocella acetinitrilica TaxID=414046 RepID=A0AAE3G617_9GAMM|nr:ABC transporter ATP-binding protein [Natronocella acetinitrilica]MCP1675073.1 NitT/TauT family transport system ATP-binding protein [Natronocella acetinitrilica]